MLIAFPLVERKLSHNTDCYLLLSSVKIKNIARFLVLRLVPAKADTQIFIKCVA